MTTRNDDDWLDLDIEVDDDDYEQERLAKVIGKVSEVCAVPAAAQKIIQLTRSKEAAVGPIVETLSTDPGLTAEVLRIANSAFFGQTRKVTDLRRAILVIGMDELNMMAGAMAMLAAFPSDEEIAISLHERATVAGDLARSFSEVVEPGLQSMAFLGGLLCEIGAMACVSVDAKRYKEIWDEAAGDLVARAEKEKRRYGAASEFIGARMLERNQLPVTVVNGVLASTLMQVDSLDNMQRFVLIGRLLTPVFFRSIDEDDVSVLEEGGWSIVQNLGFSQIDEEKYRSICVGTLSRIERDLPQSVQEFVAKSVVIPEPETGNLAEELEMDSEVETAEPDKKPGFFSRLFGKSKKS